LREESPDGRACQGVTAALLGEGILLVGRQEVVLEEESRRPDLAPA
jgi:hypothetical protein